MQRKFRNGIFVVFFLSLNILCSGKMRAGGEPEDDMSNRIVLLEKLICQQHISHEREINEMILRINRLEEENKKLHTYINKEIKKQDEVIVRCAHAVRDATGSAQGVPQTSEGIKLGFSATGLAHGIITGGNGMRGDAIDATWTADLELTKEFENCGRAYAHIEMGEGAGLDDEEVTFFSDINRDAGDTKARLEVTELYYEVLLPNEGVVITGGKLDPTVYLDDSKIANDETTQFLSAAFRNAPTIEFPDNNLGGRIGVQLGDGLYGTVGILEDDGDFEDIGDGLFTFAQLAYTSQFIKRPGTYRIYGWHDTSAHTALKDDGMTKEHNYGFGFSIDQTLIDSVIGFGRFGWADPSVSTVEYIWSSGVQINGDLWNRKNDYIAIAVGQNIPGDGLEKSGSTNHKEGQFELYYCCQLYEHLAISPHIQVVWNPNGVAHENTGASDSTIIIIGLRSQLDF